MKTPICLFDAKTGVLCSQCENKLKNGTLTQEDVQGATKLVRVLTKNNEVDKFTLINARRINDDFILVMKGSDILSLKSNPKLINLIEKEFQSKVWFLESDSSPRRFLENIFSPAKINNTNMIWLPDGHKVTQVSINREDYEKISRNIEKIKQIAYMIKNVELMVSVLK